MPSLADTLAEMATGVPRRPGNVDLNTRPVVANPGTDQYSTVRSMSFGTDEGEVLVPTVSDDGRLLTDAEAVDQFRRTGKHLGIFNTPEEASAYAQRLHEEQERQYRGVLPNASPP